MSKAHRILAGLATALLAGTLVACSGGGTIATVNGQAISQASFDSKLEGSPAARGTLQQMVQEALIEQYAKNNNINVTDADITAREDQLKANFPNGSWGDMLKARGLTEADVHNALREQIILDKAVGGSVKVSDAQISAYFAKNHAAFDKPAQVDARHILVPDLATANKIEAQLKAGAKFSALAKQYSMDPGSKDKGGELGWFRRGQMVPAFDQAAFSLPIGKISAPVKSPFGYHIIQVEKRQPGVKATLANTHDRIADLLRQQQEAPLIQPFLAGLQEKATITVNDPRFAGLFPSPPPAAAPAASVAPAASSSP
ncbi:MAG TPA: peptidylprolyl isomerase [Candidatus Dormibacteraeota bacterium]|nr:peptidylprolyl isomerase [Candidatus Dormibacteraeota bacterium]